MRILILVPALGLGACDGTGDEAPTRVVVTLVSHNETYGNTACDRVLAGADQQRDRYLVNRAATVDFAHRVLDAGAAWDFQSDWLYLERVATHDSGGVLSTTDGKNLVQWLAEVDPDHVRVDPHSHEKPDPLTSTTWNYADVAEVLVDLGAPESGVVGGFIASPPEDADWERFREGPLLSRTGWSWQPTVLWGAGSADHVDDPSAAGIWRPRDAEHFFEDDPDSPLPHIGSFDSGPFDTSGVDDLLEAYRAGDLEEGRLYTARVFVTQCDLDLPGKMDEAQEVLDALDAEVATGDLAWATLPDILDTWRDEYAEAPVVLRP